MHDLEARDLVGADPHPALRGALKDSLVDETLCVSRPHLLDVYLLRVRRRL
jgi:hypothetical protein